MFPKQEKMLMRNKLRITFKQNYFSDFPILLKQIYNYIHIGAHKIIDMNKCFITMR